MSEYINKIICGDNIEVMKTLPDNSVDLIVTSPPYDNVRDYEGFNLDLHAVGEQAHRVLKDGGMCVMVIQDGTKNFGKTLTSFRTILDWCDSFGFKLFETVLYSKHGTPGAWWSKRFRVDHEYMPIFLKGKKPAYFNKEPLKIPSKHGGKTMTGGATRLTNGKTLAATKIKINKMKCRGTLWEYKTCGDGSKLKHKHPATFPNMIPYDFIECFSPPEGVVLDPFNGSGTTCVAAKSLGRKFVGIDSSENYCNISRERLETETIERATLD
jgi:site-specific DNA-methyltransferase (adenine-specific)